MADGNQQKHLLYYRVLVQKREFIPRGTQNIKLILVLIRELLR